MTFVSCSTTAQPSCSMQVPTHTSGSMALANNLAARLQHWLDPDAGGAIGLGDIVDALVIARRERSLASEREYELMRQQHVDGGAPTQSTNAINASTAQTSRDPWLTFVPRNDPETDAAASTVPARVRIAARSCSRSPQPLAGS